MMKQSVLEPQLEPTVDRAAIVANLVPQEFAGDPTNNVTPRHLYDFCVDTAGAHLYWASTTASSGWKKLNN